MSNTAAAKNMAFDYLGETIDEYIEQYRKCKVCGAVNNIDADRPKELGTKLGGIKYTTTIEDNIISTSEYGPYKIWIAKDKIDIKTNQYTIDAIKDYEYNSIFLNLRLACQEHKKLSKNSDPEKQYYVPGSPSEDYDDGPTDGLNGSHYSANIAIDIDQKEKKILKFATVNETLDNGEFVMNKNFSNNATRISRKPKSVRLPFVYEKDFKDFDFNKILTISSLLK